jgi:hypothetical protein
MESWMTSNKQQPTTGSRAVGVTVSHSNPAGRVTAAKVETAPGAPGGDLAESRNVVQRDDGLWAIGWGDGAAGPFESRGFAEAVASKLRFLG